MLIVDGWTDGHTNGRKLACLCLPAKAGATVNAFHSNFAYAFVSTMSRLGLLMGKITELWHLSMYKKWILASGSFTIWSLMVKLHKK